MMNAVMTSEPEVRPARNGEPRFVFHASFDEPDAHRQYGSAPTEGDASVAFMPDDLTRENTKRMHYAAWRASRSRTWREAVTWRRRYYDYRDRIVLGNRKLTFRAVQKWGASPQLADDMAGECQIVLIKAVEAYNPWLGIRFSTYAFTCLMRALSRLSHRYSADRLSRSLSLNSLSHSEPSYVSSDEPNNRVAACVDNYLRAEDPLLTSREKTVLIRRYRPDKGRPGTLEQVGHELGLSKERVRQLQNVALGKLRQALLDEVPLCGPRA